MSYRIVGSLLRGGALVLAMQTSTFAGDVKSGSGKTNPANTSNNFNNSKSNSAGIAAGHSKGGGPQPQNNGIFDRWGNLRTAR